ncbi:MAG: Cif family virulence factor, partial [Dehalococcoidia bacterium]
MPHLTERVPIHSLARTLVLGIVLGLVLFTAHGGASPAKGQQVNSNRAVIIQQLVTSIGDGDVDAAMLLVADNVTWISGRNCPAQNPCQGADAVRQTIEDDVAVHTSFTMTSVQVLGSVAVGQFQVQNDATRTAGVDRVALTFTAQLPQDKVTVWLNQPDRTDPQTAAFLTG